MIDQIAGRGGLRAIAGVLNAVVLCVPLAAADESDKGIEAEAVRAQRLENMRALRCSVHIIRRHAAGGLQVP